MKNVINMDITTKIKRSKLLYYVYYYVMSGLVNLYKLFLKPDGKLMLFYVMVDVIIPIVRE